MQRKRGELVPIGDALSGMGGPVKSIREASPQARRGFTLADQVHQLVRASEADPDLGFMARTMALCSLPRSNPGNRLQYKRVNGPFTLYMTAGGGNKLPYGNLPRLMLAWVCTEAVRTPKPRAGPGSFALGVHADPGYLQQQRQSAYPPPQPNEAAVRLHRDDGLRGTGGLCADQFVCSRQSGNSTALGAPSAI